MNWFTFLENFIFEFMTGRSILAVKGGQVPVNLTVGSDNGNTVKLVGNLVSE